MTIARLTRIPVVTITSRGQFRIPAEIYRELGWLTGDQVVIDIDDEGRGVFSIRKATPDEVARRQRAEEARS